MDTQSKQPDYPAHDPESHYFIGEVRLWDEAPSPERWIPCDGRYLQISHETMLFTVLGFRFGDGGTNFALPNLPAPSGAQYFIACRGYYPFFDVAKDTPGADRSRLAIEPVFPKPEYIGEVRLVPWDDAWIPCDGRILSTRKNEVLYSLIGTKFGDASNGGDSHHSKATFAVPAIPHPAGALHVIAARGKWPSFDDRFPPVVTAPAVTAEPSADPAVPLEPSEANASPPPCDSAIKSFFTHLFELLFRAVAFLFMFLGSRAGKFFLAAAIATYLAFNPQYLTQPFSFHFLAFTLDGSARVLIILLSLFLVPGLFLYVAVNASSREVLTNLTRVKERIHFYYRIVPWVSLTLFVLSVVIIIFLPDDRTWAASSLGLLIGFWGGHLVH